MSKYKVGDRVVVISEEKANKMIDHPQRFVSGMKKYCGKSVTIEDICEEYSFTKYFVEENNYGWCDDFFEGLEKDIREKLKIKFSLSPHIEYSKFWESYSDKLDVAMKSLTDKTVIESLKDKKEKNTMNKKEILAVRNYNDRAMVMQFNKKDKNGKNIQTRAEVQNGDTFDLDEGIKTCLLKYLLGGHKQYMAIMDAARKSYKKTIKADWKKAAEAGNKVIDSIREENKKKIANDMRNKELENLIANAITKALSGKKEEDKEKLAEE